MKFIDINAKEHTFELDTTYKVKEEDKARSGPQYKLGALLCKVFGRNNVFEDYPLPGCANLSWDFWIPHRKMAFEFHGQQHFKYVKFFHETVAGYRQQIKADDKKSKIATLNDVTLIVLQDLDFTEWSVDELKKIIEEKL